VLQRTGCLDASHDRLIQESSELVSIVATIIRNAHVSLVHTETKGTAKTMNMKKSKGQV
jgi:hypothetical protein